jgi:hypothetical protein
MTGSDYDTFCGIFCGACSILVHGETGRADGFVSCCGGVPKGDLACGGCKSDAVYAGCRTCGFRDCAVERGVAHCVECADYPCKSYRKWQSAAKILPHVRESVRNLEAIRRDGADAWIEAQEKRWSCPDCGAPFSWYAAVCPACGRDLGDAAYAIRGLRRLVCRFLLPSVYKKGKSKQP